MSLRDFSRFDFTFSDLPVWRKTIVLCAAGIFFFIGGTATFKEVKIYKTAPSAPVTATQQIYPVHVMHGFVKYVTHGEEESFVFWKESIGNLVGLPLIIAFVVLFTHRKGRETQVPTHHPTPY